MSNNYRSSHTTIIGGEGMMYNETTDTPRKVNYKPYGIFSNDNTYAVTFNVHENRPPTQYFQHKPVRYPFTNEHETNGVREPPVCMTEARQYLHKGKCKRPPVLPPYLKKPEDLGNIQGRAYEKNKGRVIYGPTHNVNITHIVY